MEQEVDAIVNSHPLGLWPGISQPQLTTVAVLCELVTALLQHTFDKCCSIAERYYKCHFAMGTNPVSIAFVRRAKKCV
jgi:hypothetical protein